MSTKKGLISLDSEDYPGREVFVIRHSVTAMNVKNVIRAWSDPPLNEEGIERAIELAEECRDTGIELDALISSDLLRATQTALEISKIAGYPILFETKALRPIDVGELTGTDGAKAQTIILEYATNRPDDKIGGGESFNVFKHRFLVGLIGILNSNRGQKLGIVTHSRGTRLIDAWVAAGCGSDLEIDLEVFNEKGQEPATATFVMINCPLVLS